jgi:hypothetical protein
MELLSCDTSGELGVELQPDIGCTWQLMRVTMDVDGSIIMPDFWDDVYRRARERGLRIAIDATSMPWVLPSSDDFRPDLIRPANHNIDLDGFLRLWSDFIDGVVERYPCELVEVWSEFSCQSGWFTERPRAKDYGHLLRAARDVIGSRSLVGLGGFGLYTRVWRDVLGSGIIEYCDVICLHPYGTHRSPDKMVAFHDVMMAEMAKHRPLYITEMGIASLPDGPRDLRSKNYPDVNVPAMSDATAAEVWGRLLDVWERYCETASCYLGTDEDPATLDDPDLWCFYIMIGGKDAVLDVFRRRFPVPAPHD